MQTFTAYTDAREAVERVVRERANGLQAAALAAFERLQGFHPATGRRVSQLAAVSEFAEAASKLRGRTSGEADASRFFRTTTTGSDLWKRWEKSVWSEQFSHRSFGP